MSTPTDDQFSALDALYVAATVRGDQHEAAKLEAAIERMRPDAPGRPVATLSAALWYAENGLPVFPTKPQSKQPYDGSRGKDDATTDLAVVREWFDVAPSSNVAIATGFAWDAVDIDPDGHETLRGMLDEDPDFPPLLGVQLTPRGGFHLLVPATGRGNTQGRWPGIDYRGAGGYIMAAPSYVDDDKSHGAYRWLMPPLTGGGA